MDIAGLTSHRRLTASHRSHFRHHARERIMQAGELAPAETLQSAGHCTGWTWLQTCINVPPNGPFPLPAL